MSQDDIEGGSSPEGTFSPGFCAFNGKKSFKIEDNFFNTKTASPKKTRFSVFCIIQI